MWKSRWESGGAFAPGGFSDHRTRCEQAARLMGTLWNIFEPFRRGRRRGLAMHIRSRIRWKIEVEVSGKLEFEFAEKFLSGEYLGMVNAGLRAPHAWLPGM